MFASTAADQLLDKPRVVRRLSAVDAQAGHARRLAFDQDQLLFRIGRGHHEKPAQSAMPAPAELPAAAISV